MDELLSLKWKNHSSTLLKLLCNILSKDLYCDATIVCHDKYYPVHRLVLSTCSDYFKDIFARAHCKHPFIIINDVEPPEMEALLNFMYKGEVNILQKAVSLLIKAAESLKIKGLAVPDDSDEDDSSLKKFNKNPINAHLYSESSGHKKAKINIKNNKGSNDSESYRLNETRPLHNVTSESSTYDQNLTCSGHMENISDSKSDLEVTPSMPSINELKTEPEDYEINSVDDPNYFKKPRLDDANAKSENFFESLHTAEDPHQDFESKHMQTLASFLPTSDNILVQPFSCDPSEMNCESAEDMQQALPQMGEAISCPYCGISNLSDDSLIDHITVNHPGMKRYICKYCPCTFHVNSWFQRHMFQHTGERPYPCPKCSYRTTRKYLLKLHMHKHNDDTDIA